ncbi:uncharacterized protein TNCV_3471131 [Trichonephila clavipes]|nr:uncharacterized protein TNCV_3471131 [Trichonephila clavipes]
MNPGQVTWTTPELAPPLPTTTPHQREDVSALDRFNVHRCPTRRVFRGTGLEPVTKQATVRYLYHSATAALESNPTGGSYNRGPESKDTGYKETRQRKGDSCCCCYYRNFCFDTALASTTVVDEDIGSSVLASLARESAISVPSISAWTGIKWRIHDLDNAQMENRSGSTSQFGICYVDTIEQIASTVICALGTV